MMEISREFNNPKTTIITIDGPAGAGKSTVAKRLAKILHFSYLDTGAMYRALTLKALNEKVHLDDEAALYKLAQHTHIDLQDMAEEVRVVMDGVDVSEAIRSVEVTNSSSQVASKPKVREVMVRWQREIGSRRNVVIEGRDTGTVVFPDATFKFFMDADLTERSRRRFEELKKMGTFIEEEILLHQINERDNMDKNREVGPLKKAADAHLIDSTNLGIDESVSYILQIIHKHG